MMIRVLTVSLLLSVLAAPAYAQDSGQDNPNTRQTDQSEEDWRKSKKKRDSGDIFKDIITNPNDIGSGGIWGGEVKAIDRLPAESRRHLIRERAKAMAETGVGEPIDAAYEPSEAAKSDDSLKRDEQEAWAEMVKEANGGAGGSAGQTGGGDSSDPSQAGQGQAQGQKQGQGSGQTGQSSSSGTDGDPSGDPSGTSRRSSPLRGGSSTSASDIMNQIKGRTNGGSAGVPQSGNPSPQQGKTPSGRAPSAQDAATGQKAGDANADANSDTQAQADRQADTQANAEAKVKAQAAAKTAAEAAAHAETISPLERIKRDGPATTDTGGRSSAADYLKRKKN